MISPNPGTPEAIIYEALVETFENLVFEEVILEEVAQNKLPESANGCLIAKMDLSDPPMGTVILAIRTDLMIRFCEAIFGMVEEEMPDLQQMEDSLGELLNTICGRMLAMKLPDDQTYNLGLPKLSKDEELKFEGEFRSVNCMIGDNMVFMLVPEVFWL